MAKAEKTQTVKTVSWELKTDGKDRLDEVDPAVTTIRVNLTREGTRAVWESTRTAARRLTVAERLADQLGSRAAKLERRVVSLQVQLEEALASNRNWNTKAGKIWASLGVDARETLVQAAKRVGEEARRWREHRATGGEGSVVGQMLAESEARVKKAKRKGCSSKKSKSRKGPARPGSTRRSGG